LPCASVCAALQLYHVFRSFGAGVAQPKSESGGENVGSCFQLPGSVRLPGAWDVIVVRVSVGAVWVSQANRACRQRMSAVPVLVRMMMANSAQPPMLNSTRRVDRFVLLPVGLVASSGSLVNSSSGSGSFSGSRSSLWL